MNKTPNEVFREYLKARIEGREMTLGELIERYPEHEKYLRRKFAALDMVSPPDEGIRKDQDLLAGSIVGDFKIIREISHGGMGVVYLAEQLSLARKVALKILRPSIFTDEKQVERFRQEGKAIAKLQHNGIVPVHLIGEHEGLFYIAMQYIEGLPLSKLIHYAKEHGLKSLEPDQVKDLIAAELPENERSSVVAPAGNNWIEMVCHIIMSVGEAVEFAHGQGILHRDIKPSNIILTKEGLPVLLDFGLSKDLASTDLTPTGEFLGTPAYSDPEVLFNRNSQTDVRSDVYSLGMSLYEMVTFHLPYGGETISEIISAIRSNDPMPPVRFNATISRDLEVVILKSICKEASFRYQSVAELTEDLRRFSEDRPVLAKAPSLKYRTAKFLKRNRTAALIAMVAIVLIITSSLTVHHFWREKETVAKSDKAITSVSNPTVPGAGIEWETLNDEVTSLREKSQYNRAIVVANKALAIAEKTLGPDHPDVATSLNNLALLYVDQGQYAAAEPLYKRALAIREKALGPDHPDVAISLNNLTVLYKNQGQYAAAEPLYKRVLSILEKALGPDHPDVAKSLNNLAELYVSQGQYVAAEPLYKRALAILEKAFGPDHPDVATSLNNLALLYVNQGQYVAAEPLYKRALSIRQKMLGPDHPDVADSLSNLTGLYHAQGQYAAAEPLSKRALAIREKTLGPNHSDVATSLNNLAALYEAQGQYAAAKPLFKRALEICEKALGPDHPEVATSLNNLAALYETQGQYAAAEPLYKRALEIREKTLDPDHPDVATSLNNLALLYVNQGHYVAAEPLFKRALEIREKVFGPDHPEVATSLNNLVVLYHAQGQNAAAEPLSKRALAICEKALGPEHPTVATLLNNLAALYEAQGHYTAAEPLFKRAMRIREITLGPDHPNVALSLENMAELLKATGRAKEAEELESRAARIRAIKR